MNRGVSTSADDLFLAALEPGGDPIKTGRYLITFKSGGAGGGMKALEAKGLRVANAGDFHGQAAILEQMADAEALFFPEIGAVLLGGEAAESRGFGAASTLEADSPVEAIEPEHFLFTQQVNRSAYLKGVLHTAQTIYEDLAGEIVEPEVLGATWGLVACKVPPSPFSGRRLSVAAIDDGFDAGHPEFAGRSITLQNFAGSPPLTAHGTHVIGTAAGPKAPPGAVPRYGIGYETGIFAANVFTAMGTSTTAMVLAGLNWAIANRCVAINVSVGAPVPPQAVYTAAGNAALKNGCLILACAGSGSRRPGSIAPANAPANSPSIVSVGALDTKLRPAVFTPGGKIDIAAPGVNIFSAWPRPTLHNTISGTSAAAAHVTGCAALWAQTSPTLRGAALRARLSATAKHLPFPPTDVGAGLVQAP